MGAVLLGASIIRGKVFPALTGWMFMGAALFATANQTFEEGQLISRALFAPTFIRFGFASRSGAPAVAGRAQASWIASDSPGLVRIDE